MKRRISGSHAYISFVIFNNRFDSITKTPLPIIIIEHADDFRGQLTFKMPQLSIDTTKVMKNIAAATYDF